MIEDGKHSFGAELIKGVVVSSVTIFLLVHIPFISAVTAILIPLPVLYHCLRFGTLPGIIIFALSMILLFGFMSLIGTGNAFTLVLVLGLMGILMSEVVRLGYGIEKTIIVSSVSFLGAGFLFLFLDVTKEGLTLWEALRSYLGKYVEANIQFYGKMDPGAEQFKAMRPRIDQITNALVMLLPGLALLSAGITAVANILAARFTFARIALPFPDYGDLSLWRAPEKLIWILIASGFMLFFPVEVVRLIGINVLLVLVPLYVLGGIAVVEFFQKKVGVWIFYRILFYLLIFVLPFALIAVCLVGLMDIWVDFRRRYDTETT